MPFCEASRSYSVVKHAGVGWVGGGVPAGAFPTGSEVNVESVMLWLWLETEAEQSVAMTVALC